jgi:hypothetical protein
MKKITIFLLFVSVDYFNFGQQTTVDAPKVKTDYLKKSKNQKTTAWVMLGGGAALIITGAVIPRGDEELSFNPLDPFEPSSVHENDGIKAGFILVGTLSMIGSIPFFIASGKNKKRTASMSFKFQPSPRLQNGLLTRQRVPAINLKINL